jgi:hypothetical protein
MPDATLPLDDLTQQIAQRQSELERLRLEYEARQARLADLARQRDELQAQLRQVEADIQAVTRGKAPQATTASATKPPQAATPTAKAPQPENRLTLGDALVEVAREADRPLTARELGEQLVLRKFPTTSGNITGLVQNCLTGLVKRGVFRRVEGQPGVVLAKTGGADKVPAAKAHRNGMAAPAKKAAQPRLRKGQPSLRSLLTDLLQKSRKPVPARDLAERVLATGYQTTSKNFTDVVWTALGQLEGAENVKGQGWRLKRG